MPLSHCQVAAGFAPMALQTGEATLPLARAVIGGLSVATLVTLFVVPGLYAMVKRDRG